MADTLEIFGLEFQNATGIKAKDDNDTTLAFIRPQGTKSITENGTADVTEYASVDVQVSGGGDQSVEAALISGAITGSYTNDLVTTVCAQGMSRRNMTSVSFPNCTSLQDSAFRYCANLVSAFVPLANINTGANYIFGGCTSLKKIALPSVTVTLALAFQNDSALEEVDLGDSVPTINNQCFASCTNLNVLVLRRSSALTTLGNVNVFNSTPFASDGAGGTIYIPKALYDHLGDGGSSDYKAATNWSTVNGYGTITWAKIEGSAYENYYADGTPIPSS